MKLKLRYYGDPILRERCQPVKEITDEIRTFIEDMIETAKAHNSIGLAACQVGRALRIFLVRDHVIEDNGQLRFTDFEVYINPKLSSPTAQKITMSEGCMSFPEFFIDVERPEGIEVEATDMNGKKFKHKIVGFKARQIMHENDHINGVLFIDRLESKLRKEVEPLIKQIKKKYQKERS